VRTDWNPLLETLANPYRKYQENRIARNSFYSVIQFVIPTLFLLGVTPVLIYRMGTESYGLWMLATSALGLMSIAEFGLNTAISKYVAEYVGSGETKALSAVLSGGLSAYVLLGVVLIVPLYIYSPALAGLFQPSQALNTEQIGSVIRIITLGFIPLLFRSGAMAVPVGLQRFEIPVFITTGYQVLSYSAALAVILFGGSVRDVVNSTVVVLWITALWSGLVAWRMLKPFKLVFTLKDTKKIFRKLLSFALLSGLSVLGSRVFSFADRFAVGAVLGLQAVAYYTVIISVVAKILQLSSALTNALMPAVSSWMASGAVRRVRAYFWGTTTALFILNFLIAGILLIFSEILLTLWMGAEFTSHVLPSFRVLIVIYALISLNAPAHYVAFGMGKPGINALSGVVGGCLTIALIFVWGKTGSLLGAAFANSGYLVTWAIIGYVYFSLNRIIKRPSASAIYSEPNFSKSQNY
jgi:O-antigen/teichoic acid export membrane protein